MKVIILCGGLGSRLAEETKIIPKPMIIDTKTIIYSKIDMFTYLNCYLIQDKFVSSVTIMLIIS